jgi:hypothetical protein
MGPHAHRAAVGIAVRALLIGTIGLALGYLEIDPYLILAYYAVFFLLAIPLLGLPPRMLAGVAAACIVVAPLLLLATFDPGSLSAHQGDNPTFGTLVHHPLGLTRELLLTGEYPALIFLAYIAAGLAIGRLDLSAKRVAVRLVGGGLILALTAWLVSWVALYPLSGLRHLVTAGAATSDETGVSAHNIILWDIARAPSWWWLASPARHSGTPIDLMLTLGAAMAVLGSMLLLTRSALGARLLSPIAAVGSMTLTLYSASLLILATGVLEDNQAALYLLSVGTALAFAVAWRRWRGQGPLEKLVAAAANRTRRAVGRR